MRVYLLSSLLQIRCRKCYITLIISVTLAITLIPLPSLATGIVSIQLPDCPEPYATNLMEVEITLDPGDSLKVYDIRIKFDTLQVLPDLSQIQQGSWFASAGPTFFWYDMIDDLLIVNQAVLGPDLAVTGNGIAFSVPVESLTPGYCEITFEFIELYNAQAEVFPSVGLNHQFSAPCTDFQLQITYQPSLDRIDLDWLPQTWTQYYQILAADTPYESTWEVIGTTPATSWGEPRGNLERYYRVRAVLTE